MDEKEIFFNGEPSIDDKNQYIIGETTRVNIDDMCNLTCPCQHKVTVINDLGDHTSLMTALQICEVFGSAGYKPPEHVYEQLKQVLKRTDKSWKPTIRYWP